MTNAGSWRQQIATFTARLRNEGRSRTEIADAVRVRFNVNARVAYRMACGWSQREVADRWSERWTTDPKTAKNISYWEQWPSKTGYAPSLEVLDRLAQIYQCRIMDLLVDIGDYRIAATHARRSLPPHPHERPLKGHAVSADVVGATDLSDSDGWYVASCKALLRLDIDPPLATDEREIVAVVDGITELDTAVSVPRHPEDKAEQHGLEVDLLYGGQLQRREHPHESFFQHIIELAEPLHADQMHSYAIALHPPFGQPLAPHFVQVPLRRLDHFDVRVRFDTRKLPRMIWQLAGVASAVINDPQPVGGILTPDRFGEVHATFSQLRQGRAYGVRWEY